MNENLILALSFASVAAGALLIARDLKASVKDGRFDPSTMIGRYFRIRDFLVSKDFPEIRKYRLTRDEVTNLSALVSKLDLLIDKFGLPSIHSGGRPRAVGNFYEALTARGMKPAKNSQHEFFAAADVTWGPEKDREIFEVYADRLFLQSILYSGETGKSFLHVSVPNPELPGVKHLHKRGVVTA